MKIRKAWEALTEAMAKDHDFAWGIQCNIAMTIMDRSESSHRDSNIAAAEIMQTLFGYDVTGLYNYRDVIAKDLDKELTDTDKESLDTPIERANLDGSRMVRLREKLIPTTAADLAKFLKEDAQRVRNCTEHMMYDPTDPRWARAVKYTNPNPILASIVRGMTTEAQDNSTGQDSSDKMLADPATVTSEDIAELKSLLSGVNNIPRAFNSSEFHLEGPKRERLIKLKLADKVQPSVSHIMPNGVGVSKTDIGHILPTTDDVCIMRAEINPDLVLEDHPELTHSQQLYIKKLIEKILNFHHPLPFK